jgi:hypothetical protein
MRADLRCNPGPCADREGGAGHASRPAALSGQQDAATAVQAAAICRAFGVPDASALKRLHSALGYCPPDEFERLNGDPS